MRFVILAAHGILVLLSPSMISAKRRTTSYFVRTTVLVGVIACLCFSVGEGLRLRPFPVFALAESEATTCRSMVMKNRHAPETQL